MSINHQSNAMSKYSNDRHDLASFSSADSVKPNTQQFMGAVANLANAVLGGGVVAFPSAFAATGWIGGIIACIGFSSAMAATLHVIGSSADLVARLDGNNSRSRSYQGIVSALLGRTAARVMAVAMTLYLFGSCTAYLNIITDQVYNALLARIGSLDGTPLHSRAVVLIIITALVILPLTLLRSIKQLQVPSSIAVFAILYLAADVISEAASADALAPDTSAIRIHTGIFAAIPIIAFAYNCHLTYPAVYAELPHGNLRSMDKVSIITYSLCSALYIGVGLAGYLLYGPSVYGDVAKNMPDTIAAFIAHGGLAITAVVSYPLLHYVARLAILDILFGAGTGSALMDGATPSMTADGMSPLLPREWLLTYRGQQLAYYGCTGLFVTLTVVVSASVEDLDVIIGIVGSTVAVLQIFVFPGLLHMKLRQTQEQEAVETSRRTSNWEADQRASLLEQGTNGVLVHVSPLLPKLRGAGSGLGWLTITFGVLMGGLALLVVLLTDVAGKHLA